MAIKTSEEIMNNLRTHLGDDSSDSALALVEDISDTLESLSSANNGTDWEQKYKDNDEAWRKRYRDRFFGSGNDDDDPDNNNKNNNNTKNKPRTFADLFRK